HRQRGVARRLLGADGLCGHTDQPGADGAEPLSPASARRRPHRVQPAAFASGLEVRQARALRAAHPHRADAYRGSVDALAALDGLWPDGHYLVLVKNWASARYAGAVYPVNLHVIVDSG